jgi:hypothetical protein
MEPMPSNKIHADEVTTYVPLVRHLLADETSIFGIANHLLYVDRSR